MKRKSIIVTLSVLFVLMLLGAFILYQMRSTNETQPDNAQLAATAKAETVSETTAPETTPPSNDTYIDSSTGLLINRKFGNHKEDDISVYPVVDWEPLSDSKEVGTYTKHSMINLDVFLHGFIELTLDAAEYEVKDIQYAFDGTRAQMNFTYVSDIGTSEWEVHAEHTGKEVDISGIGGAEPSTIFGPKERDGLLASSYSSYYSTPGGGFQCAEVYLFYSPATGNMYSLHSKISDTAPRLFIYGDKMLPSEYFSPSSERVETQFTIKCGLTEETYSHLVGMNFKEWVASKYNTDGWKQGNGIVISPDGKYCITDDTVVSSFAEVEPMR